MIDRQGGQIVFECDSCDEVYESDTDDFQEAWSAAKREGWRARRLDTGPAEWIHECPKCNGAK